jgi:hypothetical protein
MQMKIRYWIPIFIIGMLSSLALGGEVEVANGSGKTAVSSPKIHPPTRAYLVEIAEETDTFLVMGETLASAPVKSPSQISQDIRPEDENWLALGESLAADVKSTQDRNAGPSNTVTAKPSGGHAHEGLSTAEITNRLNNPGASLAQLNFKFTWNHFTGNLPGSSSQDSMTMLFQPVIPFKLSDGGNLIFRPTVPITWQPGPNRTGGGFDEQFGMGDIQLDLFYSRTNRKKGYMWGLGAVMQFPTHTDDSLGVNQFQLGPSGFFGVMGKWGSVGLFPQHLWNVGGSSDGYTATTYIQPWYWFNVGGGYQVGGAPIMIYDWAADNNDEAWTVPINLGIAKTFMFGKTPVKIKFEAIYYITQPDSFGPDFGFQLTITPVVPNTLGNLFK